jgi:hypothetical protein
VHSFCAIATGVCGLGLELPAPSGFISWLQRRKEMNDIFPSLWQDHAKDGEEADMHDQSSV